MMQAFRNSIAAILGRNMQVEEQVPESLPTGDEGWSEPSAIYALGDFEKYNPDTLIGRRGYAIYRKMMVDEQIKAVVKFKRDAITAKDWYFEIDNSGDILSDEEVERRTEIFYKIIDKMHGSWMDALNGVMSAIYNGFSMTEKIFSMIDYKGLSYWGLDQLKLKPYDTFFFNVDDFSNILSITQKMSGQEQFVDQSKFIHYVMNPDVDEHYGSSELREAYRAWFSKDIIYKFRNIWLEKHAGGFRWVQAKEKKTINPNSAEFRNLQNMLNNIQTSTGLILPSSVEMQSDYPANNVAYADAINECDTAIARALLVPNLLGVSPQGNVGSYAQSTNQLEAFMWTLEADGTRLEEALNEQLFRQLGEVNFGDDLWPKFKFKPAAGTKKLEIITAWKDLVTGKAVRATETDETHLRELLEFPEAGEEINKQVPINDIGNGDSNIDPDDIGDSDIGEETGTEDSEENTSDGDEENKSNSKKDETVIGNSSVIIGAFARAITRVDFKVIDRNSEAIAEEYRIKTSFRIDDIVEDLLTKFKNQGNVDDEVRTNLRSLKVDSGLKRKLNSTISEGLKEGFALGQKHATFEIDKAKKETFSRRVDVKRIDMLAKDFLKLTSFKLTGDFIGRIISIMEQEILNGSKKESSLTEIETAINDRLAVKGLVSQDKLERLKNKNDFAVEDVIVGDFGIGSILKTFIFDSINTARHNYFTDPELDDFVQAFEYSAILDSRTTQICRHLDEGNAGNHSVEWYDNNPGYRPPNHSNCRSLLIPVTKEDVAEYEEGPEPVLRPQEGFA